MPEFLPVSRADMAARGWEQCDFVYVIGDAYVDHPSFGHAIISRVLEAAGYKVGILSQPDWKDPKSVCALGRPRLGFLVTGGNMDSMVNHYSVSHHRRKTDAFTPGGVMGKRPDRATIVYCNLIRQSFRDVPILIGGVEASLRRLAHYDYWSDQMRRSILLDAQADLLLYGMGERSIREVADGLNSGLAIEDMTYIDGTVYRTRALDDSLPTLILPDFEALRKSPRQYAESFRIQYRNTDPFTARRLAEPYGREFVVQNPPQKPLTQAEMDGVYDLPYCRDYHPSYRKSGGVPAIQEVKFSLVSNRGCFGACSFCALTFHQGRIIQTRSHHSILTEAQEMTHDPDFKGYIHDVGGPTADFRAPACDKQLTKGVCPGRQCLFPSPCPNLRADHSDYLSLLRKLRKLPGVKKVFIRSGIRFDYVLADKRDTFLRELVQHHVSGQLKVAPEHVSDAVLSKMGKPKNAVYQQFAARYFALNQQYHLKQYLVPYLMSSHPGSTLQDAVAMAQWINQTGRQPEQVQDFYPTPGTLSTCMYYTGLDPRTLEPVYIPKSAHEKAMQRALLQWKRPDKRPLVEEALHRTGRTDLIGYGPQCLLRPERPHREGHSAPAKAPQRAGKSHAKGAPSSPRNRQKPSGRPGKKRR